MRAPLASALPQVIKLGLREPLVSHRPCIVVFFILTLLRLQAYASYLGALRDYVSV